MGNKRGLSEATGRVPQRPLKLAMRRAVGTADQGKRSNKLIPFMLGAASGSTAPERGTEYVKYSDVQR